MSEENNKMREELTEERILDMLENRQYKELKEELENNMYPAITIRRVWRIFWKNLTRSIWSWCSVCWRKKRRRKHSPT